MNQESSDPQESLQGGVAEGGLLGDLSIEAMAHGGAGIGREAEGRVVFVEGALPGERVEARVHRVDRSFARARLSSLPDSPSPDRQDAPCPHFGAWPERGAAPERHCGGCQWQHASYAAQLRYKQRILEDALERIGRIEAPPVLPPIGMEDPWRYRNKLRLRAGPKGMGLISLDDARIVPLSQCPIALPEIEALIEALDLDLDVGTEVTLRASDLTGDRLIIIHADAEQIDEIEVGLDASVVLLRPDGGLEVAAGRPYLIERLEERDFIVPAASFFQVNRRMTLKLVEALREAIPDDARILADVYSGVATFSTLLAPQFEEVFAIESDREAVAAALDNASGLEQISLVEADAAEGLAYLEDHPDTILVDPPRGGLAQEMSLLLADHPAHTIAYVSCEPTTLARDLRILANGGWRLQQCQPVDMFPQTYHIESVNLLRRIER
jgi:23S rRNA (uracil1939-C5)-methyltransferase